MLRKDLHNKSKIERWFLTLRLQFLSALDMRGIHSLEEMRAAFFAYVQRYSQTAHSSLGGMTPEERFFSEPEQIRRLPEELVRKSFLYEVERRVSPDNVIVLGKTEYEIHYRYARQRIRLRYSPDRKTAYVVEPSGELVPVRLRPLDKQENAGIKRERFRLSGGGDGA